MLYLARHCDFSLQPLRFSSGSKARLQPPRYLVLVLYPAITATPVHGEYIPPSPLFQHHPDTMRNATGYQNSIARDVKPYQSGRVVSKRNTGLDNLESW